MKKLSLDQNKIFRIPYLQQVQLPTGPGDWVTERPNSQKDLQPQTWIFETPDEQPDYTVLPMKKDVDRTGEPCPLSLMLAPLGSKLPGVDHKSLTLGALAL